MGFDESHLAHEENPNAHLELIEGTSGQVQLTPPAGPVAQVSGVVEDVRRVEGDAPSRVDALGQHTVDLQLYAPLQHLV